MMPAPASEPLRVGTLAPDVVLPAVNRPGCVALHEYRGTSAVLLGLYRGLECPFCRQQIVRLALASDRLHRAGITPLAVICTPRERAAVYIRHRPTPVALLADPDATSHRAFGLPRVELMLDGGEGVVPTLARGNQVVGHFLIDRAGVIRWTHVEGVVGPEGRTVLPSECELFAAAALIAS